MKEQIDIPDSVSLSQDGTQITADGDEGTVVKEFNHPKVDVLVDDDAVTIETTNDKRKQLAMVGTYRSHLQNMFHGVTDGFEYKLKTVYAHFPMTVKVEGDEVVIQNFIGEQAPRRVSIPDGVSVQVDEDELSVTGSDKEAVSQTAANIEQICKKGTRDPRRFQDGIYITQKGD